MSSVHDNAIAVPEGTVFHAVRFTSEGIVTIEGFSIFRITPQKLKFESVPVDLNEIGVHYPTAI